MGGSTPTEALNSLLPRCRRGDQEAFVEVYRLIGSSLYGTALRLLTRPQEAEEAVQEAFVKFYQKAESIQSGSLSGWLHRVTVNFCLDRLRSKGRQEEGLVEEPAAPAPASRPGDRIDLSRAVARLPRQARLVFLLHDLEGYKHREVAETLGITQGTSKSQLFRAREMLRGWLGSEVEETA
ncbi:MAG: RNA polymerase sigma factor [Acidobacteria bacterium]|nr:MAG: RNA polymerase sigma factor [Acidobacteriota bacterium]